MAKKVKLRLDSLIIKKGLADSPEKALVMIMAGNVVVQGAVVSKAGTEVADNAEISIIKHSPYIGRGSLKLEGALNYFSIDVHDAVAMDIGASTGGFTRLSIKERG